MTDEELIPFLVSAHFFAGCGGDICGFEQADWTPTFAVELKKDRCQTIRANNPFIKIFQGPIQSMTNDAYPNKPVTLFFMTFPCDNYTLAANVHKHWTGDELYLEALREVVLHYPELIVIENVWGIKKFKRVMETFRTLPLYHCTEFLLYGDDFTHQFLLVDVPIPHFKQAYASLRLCFEQPCDVTGGNLDATSTDFEVS